MHQIKIYLAGKMSGLTFEEMNGWREEFIRKFKQNTDYFKITVVNPCEYYNFEMDANSYTDREAKEFDLYLVKNSDIIVANLDYPNSIGTAIEVHMAHDVWGKPVIGFGTTPNHPWIELSLTKKCENMNAAITHIKDFYIPNI